ncbi:M20/M25/M40 family metallo-hydrolase [Kordiimonas laminariae]|uniref:M20/M25/M40 family metallo-hydrolase n=1 Tax=Kordiimonas laminariae TaxID=2917717 RepID=UPI001FF2C3CE|nr:M20/M25/M40 family metallo-hydrolase [Kordiimonas laminariae]MCK0070249.1 M20/M25/M40 family metallo-hydrolase [Kordiimonas laminariae]
MKALRYLLYIILGLVIFTVSRTFLFFPAAAPVKITLPTLSEAETAQIAENLSKAITFKTISQSLSVAPDHEAFTGFHAFLAETFPAAHWVMERELVSDYSLMYRWPGKAGGSKKPIAFLGHMDVVPVPEFGLKDWVHPPYAGTIDENGVIWGRGAVDDKGMLMALLEAAERLVKAGFEPDRDIYFMFGHDEELGGDKGAAVMAGLLKERGVQLDWAVDEGSAMVDGVIPGVNSPIALISLGEKGSVTLKFSATEEGGHSSAPKDYTAASIAAAAGVAVTENQYPLVLDDTLERMFTAMAPQMNFQNRLVIGNMWLTKPLMKNELSKNPTIAAFMHTTTAFTMMQAGTKTNILPQYGEAHVNYRIHPRDTVDGVVDRARGIINDDRVEITKLGGREATSMSSVSSEGYADLSASIREVFGPIPVAPTLTVQGTDARHYYSVADNVYRFMPFVFEPDGLKQIHGTNEAISTEAMVSQVVYFEDLIRRSAQ